MAVISKKYPGKSDDEIYEKVDSVMEGIARRHALDYRKDAAARSGSVAKMGASGSYLVADGQVTVELKYPMLVPSSMRKKVEEDIERKLEELFG
ncbi:MAG TPA: polyhydroxyalkanoic acid system family protein [Anaeromyxobacter sp.]|nr:polyhydroxyalkanoic acid system family protein [Anaeromyxobacter sp.]